MVKLLCLVIIVFGIIPESHTQLADPFKYSNEFLVTSITKMVEHELKNGYYNCLINYKGSTTQSHNDLGDHVNEVIQRLQGVGLQIGDPVSAYQYVRLYFIDSAEAMEHFTKGTHQLQSYDLFLLVLVPGNNIASHKLMMTKIFKIFLNLQLLFVNIILRFNDNEMRIYTYYPYTPGNCENTSPILITKIKRRPGNQSLDYKHIHFIRKILNFNGCDLYLGSIQSLPYMDLSLQKQNIISGIEGEILKEVAHVLNFTVRVIYVDTDSAVYKNGTTTGVFQLLKEGRVNFTMGDFSCSPRRSKRFKSGKSHMQSDLMVVVRASLPYTSIQVLFYPFNSELWALCIWLCIGRFLILKLFLRYLRKWPRPFKRFMIAMWFTGLFFLRSAYEGSYFTYMTNHPLRPMPRRIVDFYNEKYIFIADEIANHFFRYSHDFKGQILHYQNTTWNTYEMLSKLQGKYGALTKSDYLAYYLEKNPKNREKFMMAHDSLVQDISCIYFSKYSFMALSFDKILSQFRSFGLITHMKRRFVNYDFMPHSTSQMGYQLKQGPLTSLSLSHLSGVFKIISCFLAASALVFIFELVSIKYRYLRRLVIF